MAPLPLGIALGLLTGQQFGVFGLTMLMIRSVFARISYPARPLHIYGIACLAKVGFTLSLFIGGLSFDDSALMNQMRLGVLSGSMISGLMGYAALMIASHNAPVGGVKPLQMLAPDPLYTRTPQDPTAMPDRIVKRLVLISASRGSA